VLLTKGLPQPKHTLIYTLGRSTITARRNGGFAWQQVKAILPRRLYQLEQDFGKALVFITKAAEQGSADAQFNLGRIQLEEVNPDHTKAKQWWRKAVDQEHARACAQFNLGIMRFQGKGATQDFKEAELWTRKAAARCRRAV
jgi:TPR repeat protein